MLLTQSQANHPDKMLLVHKRLLVPHAQTRAMNGVWLKPPADEMEMAH